VATAVVFVVTAVTSAPGLVRPGVLAALQRTPQGLHGDWWRSVTALFVPAQVALARGLRVGRLAGAAATMAGLVLLAARDLRGAAMVAGMAIAAVVGRPSGSSWAATSGPCGWRRRGG
jgi:hypothetical protein